MSVSFPASKAHSVPNIDDLVLLLEIDLLLGDKKGFRRRIRHALENASKQGACRPQ